MLRDPSSACIEWTPPFNTCWYPPGSKISGFSGSVKKWKVLKTSTSGQNPSFSRILHVETYPPVRDFRRRQNTELKFSKLTAVPKLLRAVLRQCLSVKTLGGIWEPVRFAKMSASKSRFWPEMAISAQRQCLSVMVLARKFRNFKPENVSSWPVTQGFVSSKP